MSVPSASRAIPRVYADLRLLLVCLLAAGGIFGGLNVTAAAAESNPVAAYSFDEGEGETVEDLTGSGHTASIEGAAWSRGRYGGAMEFDASEHDLLSVADSPDLDFTEEFTLEAWVRPSAANHYWAPIVDKQASSSTTFAYWLYAGQWEEKPSGGTESSSEEGTVTAPDPLPKTAWSHVALTYDGNHIRIYVDGELVGTDTSPAPQITAGELQIGGSTEHGDWFDGRIDELRIYDRALDAGEIAADKAAPLQTPQTGPIAAYSFDEGEGETVTDLAGGHDAAIEGAEWTDRGRYGGAMEFDRPSLSYLSVPDSPEFDFSEEFTLEAWVRPNEETYWSPTIVKQTGKEEGDDSFAYRLYAAGYEESHPLATIKSGPKEEEFLGVAPSLPTSAWSHLAFTYDGDQMSLYIDGELIEQAHSDPPISSEGDLQIGGATELHDYFDGRIDEVRIYNRALDAGEITTDRAAPIQTPQQGPVAAYSFDDGEGETVEDLTGNGHTGTIEGATWTDRGKYGGALDFVNSPGDVVKIADSPDLQLTEEFTLEAWVRPTSTVVNGVLITKATENFYSYTLYAAGSPYPGKPFGVTASAPYSGTEVEAPEPLEPHRWTHLAMTYDGSKLRLYLDGELVDTEDGVDPMASEGPLELGGMDVFGDYLQGRLDEVRIYDRALDAGEIAADRAAPIQTPQAAPVAAYSFDEGEGETVEDLTGNGHTATIEGADWSRGRFGGAMEFDASEQDVLNVADAADLDFTEEFTLEAWVRSSAENNQWAPIATKTQGGEEEGNGYAYLLYEGGGQSSFPFGGIENSTEEFQASAGGKKELERKTWAHVALTYDGAKLRLWVDGELIDESNAEDPRITEGDLEIGGFSSHSDYFDGRIDELRFYDRALDAGEIAADRAAPLQTPQEDPVAAYSFDEGKGETVEDLTGSGHTATIEGADWTTAGRYGGAMEFDASEGDLLKVAAAADLDLTEEFTIEAWVRPSDANNQWAPVAIKPAAAKKKPPTPTSSMRAAASRASRRGGSNPRPPKSTSSALKNRPRAGSGPTSP